MRRATRQSQTGEGEAAGGVLVELVGGVDEVEDVVGGVFLLVKEEDGPRDEVAEVEEADVRARGGVVHGRAEDALVEQDLEAVGDGERRRDLDDRARVTRRPQRLHRRPLQQPLQHAHGRSTK